MKSQATPITPLSRLAFRVGVLGPLCAITLGGSLQAATTTWQAPTTITTSDEVNTTGTQVYGRSINVTTGFQVNGVKLGYMESWTVGYSESGAIAAFATGISGIVGSDSTDYMTVLGQTRYAAAGASMTLNLTGLTIGQDYLVQIWAGDYRAYTNDHFETITATGTNVNTPTLKYLDSDLSNNPGAAHGQFVIGTWTADATTMSFTLASPNYAYYSAMQVRNVTVPEPSAALLGGLGMLALLRRRRA